jgi:hypothetical protein
MFARGRGFVGVLIACIALTACQDNEGAKTERSSAERVAAELDMCGEEHQAAGFAQNVCANRPLAALDTQIREALVAESAAVSDAGAQMLVQNQRRWREAVRLSCGVDETAQPTTEQQQCLEGQFRNRLQAARTAVQEMGGYVFQRMELVDAAPVSAQIASSLGDVAPPAVMRDIRFPRIDGDQTPEIQRFNDLVAQQPQYALSDGTNEIVDYEIVYAGPEMISVRFNTSEDTIGAAHPNNSSKAVTVLMQDGRPIAASDVFRPGSEWEDFLTERAVHDITREFADYGFTPPERDVRETVTKPHLWLVTERGLIVIFPPYSFGGPHVLGGAEVTIPWAELRPYLNPGAPAPIRATA